MDAPHIQQQGEVARTLAFFCLTEAAGQLPEKPSVRVIELSIAAVTVADLRAASPRLPRILHRLTMSIHLTAISGVGRVHYTNPDRNQSLGTATCLEGFLQRLSPPVCLVAHRGHQSDFRRLAEEFLRAERTFPTDILCADTLPCFRELLCQEQVPKHVIPRRRLRFGATQQSCSLNSHKLDSSERETKTVGVAEAAEREPQQTPEMPPVTIQESTPERKKPKSFRVDDLVKLLAPEFKADTLQSVEGDVMALLHCASALVDQFVPWINEHAEVFPGLKTSKRFSQRHHL